ncbi:MAG: extracellular solute-binding protein [Eubacteriales bacterium]
MKMARLKSVSALLLALLMVAGMIVPVAAAEDTVQAGTTSIEQVKEILGAATYDDYLTKYAQTSDGKDDITLAGGDFDAETTTADAAQLKVSDVDGVQALYTPEAGIVQWKFTVETEGMYNIALQYRQVDNEKASSIERIVRLDGKIPFKEARYITMTKVWSNDYTLDEQGNPTWKRDSLGNDMRPRRIEKAEWRTVQLEDSSAFYNEPFIFYLSAGEHTISMESVREPVYVGSLRIFKAKTVPTYEEYLAANSDKPEGTAEVKVQTEYPEVMSDISLYPINDRTSPVSEPQDASRIRLNTIGSDKWKQAGQWLRWEVDVPAGGAGMYSINLRFKQIVSGVYSSRSIRINGETPFKEARNLRFLYNDNWQISPLSDADTSFKFYLAEGTNVIEMEVVLGDMAQVLRNVELSLSNMNEMYRKILMITGPSADVNRDYGFEKLIPEVLEGLIAESDNLYAISKQFEEIIGQKGEYTVLLDKIALLMSRMGNDTDKIASSLGTYKSNIGSLGTWLLERRNQPLEVDYMLIQPADAKLPRADANFVQSFMYEVQAFFLSFFNDYSSIGSSEEFDVKEKDVVQVWIGSGATIGRDQAQIIRQMIDDTFSAEYNVRVNLKLVAVGTLLPATLAGTGPDVALTMNAGDPVNFAIRSAVLPLNDFPTFNEVTKRFSPSAVKPLTLFESNKQAAGEDPNVYGLPENQTFPMMFYRKDIFAELDIEIPKTWDELYALVPVLQTKSMEVGMPRTWNDAAVYVPAERGAVCRGRN